MSFEASHWPCCCCATKLPPEVDADEFAVVPDVFDVEEPEPAVGEPVPELDIVEPPPAPDEEPAPEPDIDEPELPAGFMADEPEVVEPDPVAVGRSVEPLGLIEVWAKAGPAAKAVANRQA